MYTTDMPLTNNEKLRRLMKKHGLTRKEVSELLGVSCTRAVVWRTPTCDSWMASEDASNYRNMPDPMMELLRLKLGYK